MLVGWTFKKLRFNNLPPLSRMQIVLKRGPAEVGQTMEKLGQTMKLTAFNKLSNLIVARDDPLLKINGHICYAIGLRMSMIKINKKSHAGRFL